MSYESMAYDLIFTAPKSPWEVFSIKGPAHYKNRGERFYLYKHPGYEKIDDQRLENFVRLNVRDRLYDLYPGTIPNLDTIGTALKRQLKDYGIDNFITGENSGGDDLDIWSTLEVIYISREDYESKILKINKLMSSSQEKPQKIDAKDKGEDEKKISCEKDSSDNLHRKKKRKLTKKESILKEEDLECPITNVLLTDPLSGTDGHTYQRSFIESWLKEHQVSPITGEKMTLEELRPNRLVKKFVEAFKQFQDI